MMVAVLVVLGLCFGSFVEALVWRLHEQSLPAKKRRAKKSQPADLSIIKGRSMCPHCRHTLSAQDLVPLLSWVLLGGRCRYCRRPIGWQAPALEVGLAALFMLSYIFWPMDFVGFGLVSFLLWLIFLVGFTAAVVYDLRWLILPNKVIYPLIVLAVVQVFVHITVFDGGSAAVLSAVLGLIIGGGLFYALFQISDGRWIGGGDVKLGAVFGLLVGGPAKAMLVLFIASALGSLYSLPLIAAKKLKPTSRIPFGPFLVAATIIVYLFGAAMINWYKRQLII